MVKFIHLEKMKYFLNILKIKKGQLGLGDEIERKTPTLISSLNNIIQISSGEHSMVLNNIGQVYSFGKNEVFFKYF
jgi:alpha-tubulin suppressor-like RCC1 family protein